MVEKNHEASLTTQEEVEVANAELKRSKSQVEQLEVKLTECKKDVLKKDTLLDSAHIMVNNLCNEKGSCLKLGWTWEAATSSARDEINKLRASLKN